MNFWQSVLPEGDFLHLERILSVILGGILAGMGVALSLIHIYRCHVDDGAHAVNIEKIGDDEEKHAFVFHNHGAGFFDVTQRVAHDVASRIDSVLLPHMAEHWQGKEEPPRRREKEGKACGRYRCV